MAAIFQLPIILLFINLIKGPLKPSKLLKLKFEGFILLGSILLAGLIAPPDLLNQTIIALPIFLMYQLGVVIVIVQNRMRTKRAAIIIEKSVQQPSFVQPVASIASPMKRVASPHQLAASAARPLGRRRPAYVGLDVTPSRLSRSRLQGANESGRQPIARTPQPLKLPARRPLLIDSMSVIPRPSL